MIAMAEDSALLTALHEGIFEQPLWSTFLDRLNDRLASEQVLLSFRRSDAPGTEVTQIYAGAAMPEAQRLYFDDLYVSNPMAYRGMTPGRIHTLLDMLEHADPLTAAMHHDRLVSMGPCYIRVLRIVEPGGSSAWLMASRSSTDFEPGEDAMFAAMAPHFAISLRTYSEIESGRTHADISSTAIRRLNFGWLTLDGRGRVLDVDPAAADFLRNVSAIRMRADGRLILSDPTADHAFNEVIRTFADDGMNRARALHISSDPWLTMLLAPMLGRTLYGDKTPMFIAYLHGDIRSNADRCEQLVDLFGLTRSEARFALKLSQGRTIAETGRELGLTIESARIYSKRVYAKTGVRGHAELVRLILTSVIALA